VRLLCLKSETNSLPTECGKLKEQVVSKEDVGELFAFVVQSPRQKKFFGYSHVARNGGNAIT
jgi:hypothetical protein